MNEGYIHVLRDHGQDICDDCKLQGDEDIEGWENFLNGEWTTLRPKSEGLYPILEDGKVKFEEVRFRGKPPKGPYHLLYDREKSGPPGHRVKLTRWSVPLPNPPQKKEI